MGFKFNPFTGTLDQTDSPDGVFDSVEVDGDITLDDGGTYATTLQLITPTANRTISFPDATGTVGLVGGSSGQLIYNNAGAYAGAPSTSVGASGDITLSLAGAASTPPVSLTGTWFSGGTSTTTKPQLLIEPTGTTSTAWSTSGTGLGVNAASGFGGNLLDLQVNGSSKLYVNKDGNIAVSAGSQSAPSLTFAGDTNTGIYSPGADQLAISTSGTGRLFVDASGNVGVGTTPEEILHVAAASETVNSRDGVILQSTSSLAADTGLPLVFTSHVGTIANYGVASIAGRKENATSGNAAGYLQFATGDSSGLVSERLRITSDGRLLVGTSSVVVDSSHAKVQVASSGGGALVLADDSTTVAADDDIGLIRFYSYAGSTYEECARIFAEADLTQGSGDKPTRLVFSTTADGASSPTERMRISANGILDTFGSSGVGVGIRNSQTAANNLYLLRGFYSATSTLNGTISVTIATNGDLANTNNVYGAISDIKLKENIVDANSQWDDIKALRPVNYNFKEGQTHTQLGLVAQEVELVSPGLVSESPDRDEEGNDLGTVTKSVNYSVLYMKAVKALQEAMERIETLEASNTDLLARVSALESA